MTDHLEEMMDLEAAALGVEMADRESTAHLHYDKAPRPITEDEAKTIAQEEYRVSGYGRDGVACYRGSDGGFYPFSPTRRGQDAIAYLNVKRADLRRRIMNGECTHTIFYNSARDTFYCG